jgi:hypothetical protein
VCLVAAVTKCPGVDSGGSGGSGARECFDTCPWKWHNIGGIATVTSGAWSEAKNDRITGARSCASRNE